MKIRIMKTNDEILHKISSCTPITNVTCIHVEGSTQKAT